MLKPNFFKIKLTLLSPVHIGSGEEYELTNYVIDSIVKDGKKTYKLFEFDEEKFFEALSVQEQKNFLDIIKTNDLRRVYKFIGNHKEIAKKVSYNQISVLSEFAKEYLNKVGEFVQLEGKQKRGVINELTIAKTYKDINTFKPIIPGSSIKGAISTAMQEYIYKNQGKVIWEDKFKNRNMSKNIFRFLQVSDTAILRQGINIGYAVNRERFEEDNGALSTRVEYINPTSEFIVNLKLETSELFQTDISKEVLIKSINNHYKPIFDSLFDENEYIKKVLSQNFLKYENLKLKDNQFLLRVGKHSGARAVTIDGLRKIKIKISGGGQRRKPNKWETLDEETTVWLRGFKNNSTSNMLPFGWVLCEILEDVKNIDKIIENFIVKNTNLKEIALSDLKAYLFSNFDNIKDEVIEELETLYDIDNFGYIEELLIKYFSNDNSNDNVLKLGGLLE